MHPVSESRVNDLGKLMLQTVNFIATQPTAEAKRMGVYVLAAIFGLLVCGIVSVAKELREERAARPRPARP